jgi:hypothetical protein
VNRRASGITGFTFLQDGRIVFASRGDLWIGTVTPPTEEEEAALEAIRFAPVAEWETANATSNSYGAQDVIPLGDAVLVRMARLRGSGSGNILKVSLPPADTSDASLKLMAETLAAAETLGSSGSRPWICAGAKGKVAFYFLDDGKLVRVQAGAEPEELGTFGEP